MPGARELHKAQARIDKLLEWQAAEMMEGRCPKCGTIGLRVGQAPDEWRERHVVPGVPDTSPLLGAQFIHLDQCPLATANQELERLTRVFVIRLEPTFPHSPWLGGKVRLLRRVEARHD